MTRLEKLKAIERIIDAFLKPEPDEGWPEGMTSSSDVLRMIQEIIGDDHAAEVERLRAKNERLESKLRNLDSIGVDALRKAGHPNPDEWGIAFAVGWLKNRHSADRDERRADAIYGAAYIAAPVSLTPQQAHAYAEDIVTVWRERAAQKGGFDG